MTASSRRCPFNFGGGDGLLNSARSPTASAPGLPPRVRFRQVTQLVLLGGLTSVTAVSIDMYLPAFPTLARELRASPSAIQLTMTGFMLGFGAGQLLAGSLSDAFGRRRPLLIGMSLYVLASMACALAPNINALILLRVLQGLMAASAVVIARAVVRDLYSGDTAVRVFSSLVMVLAASPIFAPLIGSQVLRVLSWRGVFGVLAALGAVLVSGTFFGLRESLHPASRGEGGMLAALRSYRRLLHDHRFAAYVLVLAGAQVPALAYVSSSSFVLQERYNVSTDTFSLLFALNGVGLIAASLLNRVLVGRIRSSQLLAAGLVMELVGSATVVLVVITGQTNLIEFVAPVVLSVTALGLIGPNVTALALGLHPEAAGSAAAMLGLGQVSLAACLAPLAGIAGPRSAIPLGLIMMAGAATASASFLAVHRMGPARRSLQPSIRL